MKKRTVSIKRTVWEIFLMTLLNVPYDPKIKTIIALSYRTYNRVFRVQENYSVNMYLPPAYTGAAIGISTGSLLLKNHTLAKNLKVP